MSHTSTHPLSRATDEAHQDHHPRRPMPTILCADDDPDISAAIDLHLRPYAVRVERSYYGMQAIWESVQQHPDLIIMDLAMPNGDGCYSLECLKQHALLHAYDACAPVDI